VRAAYDRSGRLEEWERYLSGLEVKHKRKYRLMEHLKRLER
jgi:uncharacterized Zn finger protein